MGRLHNKVALITGTGGGQGRAAALRTSVEQALMSEVPGLRASIQLLPSDVEAHFDDARDLK